MTRKYLQYAFSAGKTPLSAKTFNDRFGDIDLRLDALEKIKVDWENAVLQLLQNGLAKINESLLPVITQAQEILASAEMQLGNGSCSIVYNQSGDIGEINYQIDEDNIYSILYEYAQNGLLSKETGKLNSQIIWQKTYLYDDKDRCIGWNVTRNEISFIKRNGESIRVI